MFFVKSMESVVAYFTGKAGLKDYSTQLQEAPDLPTAPVDGGGYSYIYRVVLQDGNILAVKCLKTVQGEYKQVKVSWPMLLIGRSHILSS